MSQTVNIALVSLFLCIQSASADGKKISILLRSGREVAGELLSAREKSLVVIKVNNVSDWELMDHPESISVISQADILKVTIQGTSHHVLRGMGLGWLAGTVVSAIIGIAAPKSKDPNGMSMDGAGVAFGMAAGGMLGLLVGGIIGGASSWGEEEIDSDGLQDLFLFRQYARYQKDEPVCLKTYGR
jgi:hypothetical protein